MAVYRIRILDSATREIEQLDKPIGHRRDVYRER